METLLAKLLDIYTIALSHDYSSGPVHTESAQLLPQAVLSTLTSHLKADGGNFSVYRADGNYLDVRGWHCTYHPNIGFSHFRATIRALASPPLRAQSSTYRCFDTNSALLIPVSNSVDEHLMTLDLATLHLKDGLSAIAAPLHSHGRPMGVIHMDIIDCSRRCFDQNDLVFLNYVAALLPPILHHNLLIEQLGVITSACFNQPSDPAFSFAHKLCASAADILLVPSVGLWLADEHQHSEFLLRGFAGPYFFETATGQHDGVRESDVLTFTPELFADDENRPVPVTLSPGRNTPFRFPADAHPLYGLFFPLRDEQTRVEIGFIGLVDTSVIQCTESYLRLATFVANFLSLTLGALSRYDARQRISYETAAHEFRRNLKNLDNTHIRLAAQLVKAESRLDDDTLFQLNTIANAFKSHLSAAIETQQALVRSPEPTAINVIYDGRYGDYIPACNPILQAAKIRQDRIVRDQRSPTQPVDLKREILDICNGYTRFMNKSSVTWSMRIEAPPKCFDVDRQNFNLVFGNVVDNAVKYAMPGSVIIVGLIVEDLRIVIHVTNIGPPIDTTGPERADIFLPHYRGRRAVTMCEGDGIGLWQAKYVATLWGGDVRLTHSTPLPSKPEGDSGLWAKNTFTIELPDTPTSHRTFRLRTGARQ